GAGGRGSGRRPHRVGGDARRLERPPPRERAGRDGGARQAGRRDARGDAVAAGVRRPPVALVGEGPRAGDRRSRRPGGAAPPREEGPRGAGRPLHLAGRQGRRARPHHAPPPGRDQRVPGVPRQAPPGEGVALRRHMRSRHFRLSILAALALGCTTMTATGPSAATAGSSASGPKPAQRVRYRPEVVFSSFGEVDFEHDNQVMQQYFTTLHPQEVTADADGRCFTRARTAKEKLDGVPAKRECLPAPVGAAPAPPSPPAPAPVKVLVDSIPEGIDITNGKIQVADGKGLVLVGRMKWEVPSTDISLASDGE